MSFAHRVKKYAFTISFSIGVCALLFSPLLTHAFFSGGSFADQTQFSSGTLATDISTTTLATDIFSSGTGDISFDVVQSGSLASGYALAASPGSCSGDFFNGLAVAVTQGGTLYDGALSALFATSTLDGTFDIAVSAPSVVATQNETCEVFLSLKSTQQIFPFGGAQGFSDTDVITLTLTAGENIGAQPTATIVLNEIYPNEDAGAVAPLEREWVELYNGTGSPVDVLGWKLSELSFGATTTENFYTVVASGASFSTEVQPYDGASTIIPAGGLLVIEFGGTSKLNNGGDTVSLYDDIDTLLDAYAYPSTIAGKSHARIPDGATWVDPLPTPGTPNTATEEDLRNEGWSESKIQETLLLLGEKSIPESTASEDVAPDQCKDGIDNDGDGWIDINDSGCTDENDQIEGLPEGYDFDADGQIVEIFEEESATTTVPVVVDEDTEESATTTPETLEDLPPLTGTSTPEILEEELEIATSTPEFIEEVPLDEEMNDTGTTTPEILTGEETSPLVEEELELVDTEETPVVEEEGVVEEEAPNQEAEEGTTTEETLEETETTNQL